MDFEDTPFAGAPPPPAGAFFPFELYPAAMLLCAIVSLLLCVRIFYASKKELARGVALYLGLVFILGIFKFAEFVVASPWGKSAALGAQWLGIAFIPCSFFVIARAFEGKPLKGLGLAAALAPGVFFVALLRTNQFHFLFWDRDVRYLPPSSYSPALGYWIFSAYAFCQTGLALAIMAARAGAARGLARRGMLLLMLVLFLPAATSALYVLFGGSRALDDPTPFVFALAGILMNRMLRSFDIFEAIPYAKDVLLESIDSPIVIVDSGGFVTGANEDARRLFPSEEAPEGKSLAELLPFLAEGMAAGDRRRWTREGIDYLVSCYETKRIPGSWKGRIFLFRDISELTRAQREVEEARARAEAANAAKSAFIATVSHELRNPLNAIIGLVDLDLESELPARIREDLEVVHSSGKIVLGLVNDLLDLSKIEARRMELESSDFDLHETVLSVLRAFRPAAEKKGLSLDLSIADGTPRFVRGDSLRFGQILMNLVSNAIKFTKSGAVSVELGPEPATEGGPTGDPRQLILRATVRDTGIGILPEGIPLLFEEFSQVDASIGRRFGGTGLGLSICKRLVELFGGRIEVSSKAGEGSVFSYTARFEPASAPRAEASEADAAGNGGLLVLVVDDDPVNAAVARRYVGRLGCETLSAHTGAEALDIVEERRPDLVLMDLGLPDMDGFEACRRIRGVDASRSGEETPVVAMTARADADTRAECASAGMRDCLTKPIDPPALERILNRIGAERRDLGPRAAYRVRPQVAAAEPEAPPDAAPPAARPIDEGALLARAHGDRAFARELLGILVSEAPEKEEAMRVALAEGDIDSLRKLAHRLKGSALTLCALPLAGAAARLESACAEAERSSRLEPLFAELEARYAGAVAEASRYLGAGG